MLSKLSNKITIRSTGLLLILIGFFYSNIALSAYAPSLIWKTLETPHFIIHFHEKIESSAIEIADKAEAIHSEVTEFFNWIPREKTHIILSDQSEVPNGSASVFPKNRIELLMAPPAEVSGLEDYDDWKYLLLKHEYVHIVHLDKTADFTLHARSFVGRHWLFFPNTFLPRWITEGLATYLESNDGKKIGRGYSSYYRALMRNEVIHGVKTLGEINQNRTAWPSGSGSYLYGVYFFKFLHKKYGVGKIKEFIENYSHFPLPYFVNTVSNITFKKDMYELWDEFVVYLNNDFSNEIHKRANGKNDSVKKITSSGYTTGFSKILGNKLYYIKSDRENLKQLIELDQKTKQSRVFLNIRKQDYIFPHSFDVHPLRGILIPLLETYENSRQSFDLYSINLISGESTQLTKDKRYLKAIWNHSGTQILALGNRNGQHHLDLLDATGVKIRSLWQGDNGYAVNAFDWSPDENNLIVSLFTPKHGWDLHLVDVKTSIWKQVTDNDEIEAYPQFIDNGTQIIFSADYEGNFDIYRMSLSDINSDALSFSQRITNSSTAALFPELNAENNRIYFSELDKNGFNIKSTKVDRVYGDFENSTLLSSSSLNISSLNKEPNPSDYRIKNYSSFKYLVPSWWIPIVYLENDQAFYGLFTNSSDPLNKHNFDVSLLYGSQFETLDWSLTYLNQQQLVYLLLNTRRDHFSSAISQRIETGSTVSLIYPYIKRSAEWQLFTSFQYLDTTLSLFNNLLNFSGNNSYSTVGLSVDSTNKSMRAVSPYSGSIASLSYEVNKIENNLQDHSRITLDVSSYSSIYHHAIFKVQGIIVAAGEDANKTYLGGSFSRNDQAILFGRNTFSLKGFAVDQFVGSNLHKVVLQSFYPLSYPETGIMRPPLGIGRINLSTSIESARVGSYNTIAAENWQTSISAEIIFTANAGYGRFPFSITVGLAKGLGDFGETQPYGGLNLRF